MSRRIIWWSDGITSAVCALFDLKEHPDAILAICDTGSEDEDNLRFRRDCEEAFGFKVQVLPGEYPDNWACWEERRYMSGIAGAPCTAAQKRGPRIAFQEPYDVHVFGYAADANDVKRYKAFRENYPEVTALAPLIDLGITKAGCLALMADKGVDAPRSYAWGFPNANCLESGCVKATSPAYWALHRKFKPEGHARTAKLSRELGCRLVEYKGERIFLDELPADTPMLNPIAPACDFLCHIGGQDL